MIRPNVSIKHLESTNLKWIVFTDKEKQPFPWDLAICFKKIGSVYVYNLLDSNPYEIFLQIIESSSPGLDFNITLRKNKTQNILCESTPESYLEYLKKNYLIFEISILQGLKLPESILSW